MGSFSAAIIQMRSGISVADNIEQMRGLITDAAREGADYIQTPEMTGLVQQNRTEFLEAIRPQEDDALVAAASALAREQKVYLHIGSTPVLVSEDKAANRAFIFGPDGALRVTYDKIHMFDVDLDNGESWRESAVYRPGDVAVTHDILGTRIGVTICYDLRFPHLHRDYAKDGCAVLTGPSCFTRQTGQAHWHVLLRARAIETGSFMIAAAQGGDMEDGRATYGHSLICDPWGTVLAEIAGEEPGFALTNIDPALSQAARAKVPNLANIRDYSMQAAGGDGLRAKA